MFKLIKKIIKQAADDQKIDQLLHDALIDEGFLNRAAKN